MKEKLLKIKQLLEDALDVEVTSAEESIENQYRCIDLLDELIEMSQELGLYEESEE